MKLLLRKIEKPKWEFHKSEFEEDGVITPYPVTNDLKTCESNTLSVWEFDEGDEKLFKSLLVTLATTRNKLQHLDYAIIRKDNILQSEISITDEEGNSPLKKFNSYHRNLSNLKIDDLKIISKEILEYVCSKSNEDPICLRISAPKLRIMMKEMIENGDFDISELPTGFDLT